MSVKCRVAIMLLHTALPLPDYPTILCTAANEARLRHYFLYILHHSNGLCNHCIIVHHKVRQRSLWIHLQDLRTAIVQCREVNILHHCLDCGSPNTFLPEENINHQCVWCRWECVVCLDTWHSCGRCLDAGWTRHSALCSCTKFFPFNKCSLKGVIADVVETPGLADANWQRETHAHGVGNAVLHGLLEE